MGFYRVYMVLGGCCLKIKDVCMHFEPCFKVHNLVSVHLKSIILCQMINIDMIFHVVVSVYWLVKIWNSSQFPVEFRNGLYGYFVITATWLLRPLCYYRHFVITATLLLQSLYSGPNKSSVSHFIISRIPFIQPYC